MMRFIRLITCFLTVLLTTPATVSALAAQTERPIYVISDLHMGVGKANGADWQVLEDFRWPRAFDGFLQRINEDNPNGVDLVIAGDFLELWQHPTVACAKFRDSECGCSLAEMKQIVLDVIAGHQSEFKSLGGFLSGTQNRVFILPGNHDAALMDDEIWKLVAQAFPNGQERLERIKSVTWWSSDGIIAIEHGHQYAFDINRFPNWPDGITKVCNGEKKFFRTAGENFVQTLYNDKEASIPLIDNMIPESIGISIYSQYSELKGKKVEDIARLAIFMLLETSVYQKLQFLELKEGLTGLDKQRTDQILNYCKRCMGETIILSSEEVQRYHSLAGITNSEQEKEFRRALRGQLAALDDNAFRELCLRAADNSKGVLKPNPDMEKDPQCDKPLGYAASKLFDPKGEHVRKQDK